LRGKQVKLEGQVTRKKGKQILQNEKFKISWKTVKLI
jgi:hypothetical protein